MAKAQAVKEPNAVVRYYRETVGELRKVTWPTWMEARNLTIIVLVVIIVMAAILGLFDFLFAELIKLLVQF
jgi:preprotein translocase subunit SecE